MIVHAEAPKIRNLTRQGIEISSRHAFDPHIRRQTEFMLRLRNPAHGRIVSRAAVGIVYDHRPAYKRSEGFQTVNQGLLALFLPQPQWHSSSASVKCALCMAYTCPRLYARFKMISTPARERPVNKEIESRVKAKIERTRGSRTRREGFPRGTVALQTARLAGVDTAASLNCPHSCAWTKCSPRNTISNPMSGPSPVLKMSKQIKLPTGQTMAGSR